jgi:hypothetical protein
LEQIAADSETHHRTVVEVLSAFVREHTIPGRPGAARRNQRTAALPTLGRPRRIRRIPAPTELDTDIQAALTVLGRLPTRDGVPRVDLTEAHLPHAQMHSANLTDAQLHRANLTGAWLLGANLTDAHLHTTNLTGAWLLGANLTRAFLDNTNLTDAQLDEANLTGVQLNRANLTGAQLHGANLTDARGLTQGQLNGASGDGRTVLPGQLARPASWSGPDTG